MLLARAVKAASLFAGASCSLASVCATQAQAQRGAQAVALAANSAAASAANNRAVGQVQSEATKVWKAIPGAKDPPMFRPCVVARAAQVVSVSATGVKAARGTVAKTAMNEEWRLLRGMMTSMILRGPCVAVHPAGLGAVVSNEDPRHASRMEMTTMLGG